MNHSLLAAANLAALLLVISFLAQAIARARWQGKGAGGAIFLFVLAGQVWLIPQAINFFTLHSPQLLYPLWFGNWIVAAAAAIVLPLTFRSQTRDLFDAARLDGVGSFGIFRHVVWPTAQPALLVLAVLLVMTTWTEFAQPLFAATGDVPTPAFADCTVTAAPRDLAILIGASLVATLPVIFIYLFARRQFVAR